MSEKRITIITDDRTLSALSRHLMARGLSTGGGFIEGVMEKIVLAIRDEKPEVQLILKKEID